MRSYVKIYGPPLMKALKALEKIAIDMPQVCIMDTTIRLAAPTPGWSPEEQSFDVKSYLEPWDVSEERCNNVVSKSSEMLGEYDFFFEWFKQPSTEEFCSLIEKIDEALAPLGCKYTIMTK